MQYNLTAAARRTLASATDWESDPESASGQPQIAGPGLLLGLLTESECRAAVMLFSHGVSAESVRRQWPNIRPAAGKTEPTRDIDRQWRPLLAHAAEQLSTYPPVPAFATEHLLLGLLLSDQETAAWLGQHGLTAADVEAEICRIYQYEPGPSVPIDFPPRDEPTLIADELPAELLLESRAFAPLAEPERPPQGRVLFRILDAAANRAREGLRVVEDYARFGLNDAGLTEALKTLRHDLAGALSALPAAAMLASRNTPGDVGTRLSTPSETLRVDIESVLAANLKRLQEALRSLEEYGKLVAPAVGPAFEKLRYRSYTIEQQVQLGCLGPSAGPRRLLAQARLYVLVDGRTSLDAFTGLIETLVTAGTDVIQLRDKELADAALIERGLAAREITRGSDTLFIMNDRADLALACQADGVHVGQDEMPVEHARLMLGERCLVGVSTHSLEQASSAGQRGADYLGVGPVFPSGTKDFANFPGLELLRQVSGRTQLPAFAIGGIDLGNVARVLEAGFGRIAVSGAVCRSPDPAAAVAGLRAALDAGG